MDVRNVGTEQTQVNSQTIASKAARGSLYSIIASAVTLVSGFLRAILLARLLAPEHFGVMTLALFYVALANQLFSFGLDHAIIHRQDADETVRSTYFTLRMAAVVAIAGLILLAAPILGRVYPAMPLLGWILAALAVIGIVQGFSYVQEALLRKDLSFQQLAILDVTSSLVMTITAPLLAWAGWGVWALVAEQASGILTRALVTWLVFRHWAPRLGWDRKIARWFWDYGKPMWGGSGLYFLTDRFDDFWIGTTLGKTLLGYYSRAYEFAHYPRRVIATPLLGVFNPVFAQLQGDRLRLSQAFYRATYIILRVSFLASGAFALVMPEFIHLVIGDNWTPMLLAFRLMLIYTLLDVIIVFGEGLLWAVGRPQQFQRITLAQAVFFIPAVILGARLWQINGVALAADAMLAIGCIILCRYLRQVVDFSLLRLTFWPVLALTAASVGGWILESSQCLSNPWQMAAGKLVLFCVLYAALLGISESKETLQGLRWVWQHLRAGRSDVAAPETLGD